DRPGVPHEGDDRDRAPRRHVGRPHLVLLQSALQGQVPRRPRALPRYSVGRGGAVIARAASPAALAAELAGHGYIVDDALAMTVYLALRMQRPLFLEGAPGVGKTLLATVLAQVF